MYQGKGPIHVAVVLGFIPVLRALLQFRPDLELEVYPKSLYTVYSTCIQSTVLVHTYPVIYFPLDLHCIILEHTMVYVDLSTHKLNLNY